MTELWNSRFKTSPEELLLSLSQECGKLGVAENDVYGDFEKSTEQSYLRRFEKEVSTTFGKEDALFLPSGVMAQIALQIHFSASTDKDRAYVCHYSSHLLLHEKDTSLYVLNMQPVVVPAVEGVRDQQPISFADIQRAVETSSAKPATVIVELPHREIGGKATSFADLEKISAFCRSNGIALHMDGARLWEALAHYTTSTTSTTSSGEPVTRESLCALFDSVYMSTYKGIGGMTGALLMGNASFIAEARVWLRRYGGNLYTLLPYAVSAYSSFRNYLAWNDPVTEVAREGSSIAAPYSMKARLARLQHLAALLTRQFEEAVASTGEFADAPLVRFDPPVPVVCLVHVYIRASVKAAKAAHERSLQETGIACFAWIRAAPAVASANGTIISPEECYFEFNVGLANGVIADEEWVRGWVAFVKHLSLS